MMRPLVIVVAVIAVAITVTAYVLAYLALDGNVHFAGIRVFALGSGRLREGAIEYFEALFWLFAVVLYIGYFSRSLRDSKAKAIWAFCFVLLCFVALGEELSWGQHLFGFETPAALEEFNKQKEFNLHNTNIAKILGLTEGTIWEQRLHNFTFILNPLFYLVCIAAWIIAPIVLTTSLRRRNAFLATYPKFGPVTIGFLGVNVLAYALIDKLWFDVGEMFELAISLTAWLSVLELRRSTQLLREED